MMMMMMVKILFKRGLGRTHIARLTYFALPLSHDDLLSSTALK